jgi:hypothetical protein
MFAIRSLETINFHANIESYSEYDIRCQDKLDNNYVDIFRTPTLLTTAETPCSPPLTNSIWLFTRPGYRVNHSAL